MIGTCTDETSRIWNDYGESTGITADPGYVGDGNLGEVHVEHENQGVYSLFSANDDAICIAWVTTTWSDERGGNEYAVTGDFGRECGGTWYASGMYPTADVDYQPDCFWIDGNGDQPKTGFQVRWPAYSGTNFDSGNTDPQTFCNNIDFGLRDESDPNTINFWTSSKKEKRTPGTLRRRASWAAQQLVLSDSKWHSAKKLCESETSMGPDFVHESEGLFCDMGTKTLYDICSDKTEGACFDVDTQTLSTNKAGTSRIAAVGSGYQTVRDWRNGTASA